MMLCLIFLSLLVVGCTYYLNIKSIIQNEVESTYEMITGQYGNSVSYKLNMYENLISSITTSRSIQDALSKGNEDYYSNIEKDTNISEAIDFLSSGYSYTVSTGYSYSEINGILVCFVNTDFNLRGKYTNNLQNVKDEAWFKQINLKNRSLQFIKGKNNEEEMSFVKVISSLQKENRLDIIGLAKIDIAKRKLFQLSDKRIAKVPELMVYIFDEAGNTVYKNSQTNFTDTGLEPSDLKSVQNKYLGNKSKIQGMAVIQDLNYRGWKVAVIFPMKSVNEKIKNAIVLIVISFIIIGIICMIIILLFSKSFAKRLGLLLKKMEKVKKGNLNIDFIMDSNDEIGIADKNFNEMVEKLKQSINENYIQKLGKREAELRALQFQINPHFLYNTLECVNSIAIINNCNDISRIVLKLGEMLRYNLNNSSVEYVELKEEIKQLHNYVDIQIIRFGNRFNVVFDIPKEFEELKILRFILQPVVENFIVHGFSEKREEGYAEISVYETDGMIEIKVQDDGMGIEEERLKLINKRLKINEEWQVDGKKKSIGLQNVNSRIKLSYGEEFGIEIESTYKVGTIVKIRIPKIF